MNETCPICSDPSQCRGYPHLWKRLREDPERWRAIHDRVNNDSASSPVAMVIPLVESIRAVKLGYRQCLYSSHEGCGCTGTYCYWRRRVVQLDDCVKCLRGEL